MIDIPYRLLKEAVQRIEKKEGTCHVLPSCRFEWDGARVNKYGEPTIQISENMPSLDCGWEHGTIKLTTLVCEGVGGESTGTAAERCENCIKHNSYSKNNTLAQTKTTEEEA